MGLHYLRAVHESRAMQGRPELIAMMKELAWYMNDKTRECYPSVETLRIGLGYENARSVQRILQQLEMMGAIKRKPFFVGQKRGANHYEISLEFLSSTPGVDATTPPGVDATPKSDDPRRGRHHPPGVDATTPPGVDATLTCMNEPEIEHQYPPTPKGGVDEVEDYPEPPEPEPELPLTGEAQELFDAWNAAPFSKAMKLTTQRRQMIKTRLKDKFFRDHWREALEKMATMPFYRGEKAGTSGRFWTADLDYFLRPNTVIRMMERKAEKNNNFDYTPRFHEDGSPALS